MECADAARRSRPVAATVVLACVVVLGWGDRALELVGPEVCPALLETGRPCMGCGGTRALAQAIHGRIGNAVALNPLGAFIGIALWLIGFAALFAWIAGCLTPLVRSMMLVLALAPGALVWNGYSWWSSEKKQDLPSPSRGEELPVN